MHDELDAVGAWVVVVALVGGDHRAAVSIGGAGGTFRAQALAPQMLRTRAVIAVAA